MPKILVVDDDELHLATLRERLKADGHIVDTAQTGREGMEFLGAFDYDLLIVDWQLPDFSGVELITRFRNGGGQTPIIMLTGKGSEDDKALGLDSGADDYLLKPFGMKELAARLRAQLRRQSGSLTPSIIKFRDVTLDTGNRRVEKDGCEISLQPVEYALLEFFAIHQQQIFSAGDLIKRVWDSDNAVSEDALYSCIRRLRRKFDTDETLPSIIRNRHGVGYIFEP